MTQKSAGEKFAIVGMACHFPGARDINEFWANLLNGVDSRAEAGERLPQPGGIPDPSHPITWTLGGWVDDEEPEVSSDSGSCAERWTARVVEAALNSADGGIDRSRTGLVLGNYCFPTAETSECIVPRLHRGVLGGMSDAGWPVHLPEEYKTITHDMLNVGSWPVVRAAQESGLGGPRLALDAACASALYALQVACQELTWGRADAMVAGGVCAPDPGLIHLSFSDLRAYPTNGVSQPFDRASTGITTGQGAGVVVVKRLEDALRDDDDILAVIEGIGWASDGNGRHLLAPNKDGQQRAYSYAFSAAGCEPRDVQYVECHATGTPLGDSTELTTLRALFAPDDMPLLGSVKGNVGHLLTVAGATSLIKAILCLRHGVIPPTIGVAQPLEEAARSLVTRATPWPEVAIRRAAVSAFGFGGTNAHVILAAPSASSDDVPRSAELNREDVVLTGLGACAGLATSVPALERALEAGKPLRRDVPPRRWFGLAEDSPRTEGNYLEEIGLASVRYRISPQDLAQFNPQHLLMLKVVEEALWDSGLVVPETGLGTKFPERRVSVLLAMDMEPRTHAHRARLDVHQALARGASGTVPDEVVAAARDALHPPISSQEVLSYISNLAASRICARWNFTGPSFSISADTCGAAQALEMACDMLRTDPTLEAVVVGGVDLVGGPDAVECALNADVLPHWAPGDGAAAVVLQRRSSLVEDQPTWGTLAGVSLAWAEAGLQPAAGLTKAVEQAAITAGNLAGVQRGVPLTVRAQQSGRATDASERLGLAQAFADWGSARIAWGATGALLGDCGHASLLLSVVEAALACSRGFVPGAKEAPERTGECFWTPASSEPWLRRNSGESRFASASAVGHWGVAAHVVLRHEEPTGRRQPSLWSQAGPYLLMVTGRSHADLAHAAREAEALIGTLSDHVLREHCSASLRGEQGTLRAVVVAHSRDQMRGELRGLISHVTAASPHEDTEWSTPAGSFFTSSPIGAAGKVAFVYPGAFTGYLGCGAELFRLFPGLQGRLESEVDHPWSAFSGNSLWPGIHGRPSPAELMAREEAMVRDIPTMLTLGTAVAMQGTDALTDYCGVQPQGALGYSLGEASMLFSLGVWDRTAREQDRLVAAECFRDGLTGAKHAARSAWRLGNDVPNDQVWASRLVSGPAKIVREAVNSHDRVWMTHTNTPQETVVAGDPAVLLPMLESLGFPTARPPIDPIMHCDMVAPASDELSHLNHYPVVGHPELELFTADGYGTIAEFSADALASGITRTLVREVDWPRLVETAYEAGFRYFIEIGPGASCTRWVEECLQQRPGVAVGLDRRGQKPGAGVARVLARLISHGVPVDVERLVSPPAPRPDLSVDIPVGAPSPRTLMAGIGPRRDNRSAEQDEPPHSRVRSSMTTQLPTTSSDSLALSRHDKGTHTIGFEGRSTRWVPVTSTESRDTSTEPGVNVNGPVAEPQPAPSDRAVVFNQGELLEFATGRASAVLGPAFASIDGKRHVRLPAPPYLLVSRVTDMDCTIGEFRPSTITSEFDIAPDAWFLLDDMVPAAITIEAGQCDLLLIAAMGVDLKETGKRVYRLLDSTLTFHGGLPHAGQRLRHEISIDRFVEAGGTRMFFFSYRCFADDQFILELEDACAGFFTEEELAASRGIVRGTLSTRLQASAPASFFKPLLRSIVTALTEAQVQQLARGEIGAVFGAQYDQGGLNRSLRLPDDMLRMVDTVSLISAEGGSRGLGQLVGEKRLDPDAWYFTSHFVGDPVLPGSLIAEGAVQMLQVFALYLGLAHCLPDAEFQTVPGLRTRVRVRGQIVPATPQVRYEVDITSVSLLPRPTVIADILVFDGDRAIVEMENFGVQLREKPGTPYRVGANGEWVELGRRTSRGEPVLINEMHMAHAAKGNLGTAMGPEFDIYEGRRAPHIPNGVFQFVDRVVSIEGRRGDLRPGSTMVSGYDSSSSEWYYGDNSSPVMPNAVALESSLQSAILLGYYLGATLTRPDLELGIRNLDGTARWLRSVDLRGKTIRQVSTMTSSTVFADTVLQAFEYVLSVDDVPFYAGTSMFGYFTEEGLRDQKGLDGGARAQTWLAAHPEAARSEVRLGDESGWLRPSHDGRSMPRGRLKLLDRLVIVPDGGEFQQGYLYGERAVSRDDWYFQNHFHKDPVMPGSLGLEALIQALQLYVLEAGLVREGAVRFEPPAGVDTTWTYRGQITQDDDGVTFDLHLKQVRRENDRVLVLANGSLYKDGLRVYGVTNIGIQCITIDHEGVGA